ncbi:hypothetical protein KY285_025158 [Solanum tuberosum]|nr:hypothetical protein KY289_025355 [Solanum tuberosum]KAH0674770.1 hypothetical protein KY284_025857 [Solanum tuberosum]KAH0677357.1 hypothetical protein KY285_025158 [Solanum tuberosum]
MSSGEMSMDTIMEDEDSFVSNTNAIIYASSDISGWTHSLISDNNIPNSSYSANVDDRQQQISTADDDSMIVSSGASSSWALCNNRLKSRGGSEFSSGLLLDTGRTVKEETRVKLVNTLMVCAEAIQENNLSLADVLISDIKRLRARLEWLKQKAEDCDHGPNKKEANHNGSDFMNRTNEAWHSTMFDLLENSEWTKRNSLGLEIAGQYLGREIYNLVACEGTERVVRHETLCQWRVRFHSTGFNLVPLSSNTYRHANLLLALNTNEEGYRVEVKDGCLMLSWHSRPLITTSAWRLCGQV